jgi:uncharacterized protein (TIGR03067 family)
MRSAAAACFLVCTGAIGLAQPDEKDEFTGTWKAVYSETGGEGFKPKNDLRIKFEKGTFDELQTGELVCKCSYAVDKEKKPFKMTATILENRFMPHTKGNKLRMIYEIDGDRLKIRYEDSVFKGFPRSFSTRGCAGGELIIYERVK